ncbi:MAG: hypothetical protein K2Q09_11265, partial [Phycisphaerales bacterium]|nr:hypothetical protein [Phycisphaerales bacterium]
AGDQLSNDAVVAIVAFILVNLSPSNGKIREKCSGLALDIVRKMSAAIRFVDFFPKNGRLAVGTSSGAICLYDVKTATEWAVLEGHTSTVSLISYAPDGKLFASYSASTRDFRVWDLEPGLLGFFGAAQPRCLHHKISPFPDRLFDPLTSSIRWEKAQGVVLLQVAAGCDPFPVQI